MIIPIGKDYRITSDPSCWIVQQYGGKDKEGKDIWRALTYHAEFPAAVIELSWQRIRLVDSSVPREIISAIKEIKKEATEACQLFKQCV